MNDGSPNNTQTKAPPPDGTFSLEDLDQIIASEDPQFAQEMSSLKAQGIESSAVLENLSIATEDDALTKDDETTAVNKKQKIIAWLKRPFVKIKLYSQTKILSLKNRSQFILSNTKDFIIHELPDRIRFWRSQIMNYIAWIKSKIKQFQAFSRLQKFALIFSFISSIGAALFLYFSLRGHFLPQWTDPLPRTMMATKRPMGVVKKLSELQDFFEAFPEVEYHLLLPKVIVNLTPDENSGPNPMGIFELFVGVDSKDTALEVKDREKEMVDVVQRTIESFTYSEVASEYGKVRMKAAIKDNINHLLNQGFVYKLYFNQIVYYSNK